MWRLYVVCLSVNQASRIKKKMTAEWFRSDNPARPMAVDGFALLHLAYGILGVYVLGFAALTDTEIILTVTAVGVIWEACEAAFAPCLGVFFGISNFEGDSVLNMSADINFNLFGTLLGVFIPDSASYIVGFVLLGLGIAWAIARWWNHRGGGAGGDASFLGAQML